MSQGEHIEIGFGIHADIENPATEIARILRDVADQFERSGMPEINAIYDAKERFVGEIKISKEVE